MKVYISADMEGVAGVVCQEQLHANGLYIIVATGRNKFILTPHGEVTT